MNKLPNETLNLLRAFRTEKDGTLTVTTLRSIVREAAGYQYRLDQLLNDGLIEPCAWEQPYSNDFVFISGAAIEFKLTTQGKDYLSMLDQQSKQRAKKRKQKKKDKARAEKKDAQNRRYERHTAIIAGSIGAAIGSITTLLVEHFYELIVWVKSLFS